MVDPQCVGRILFLIKVNSEREAIKKGLVPRFSAESILLKHITRMLNNASRDETLQHALLQRRQHFTHTMIT